MLTGQQTPDTGVVEPGETVVFGTYDQMGMVLDDDQRVMDFVKQRVLARDGSALAEAPSEVMKLLKQFQFPKERWNERILRLSGGERRRLQLLSVLTQRPNFLILDEPVNDIFNCLYCMRRRFATTHTELSHTSIPDIASPYNLPKTRFTTDCLQTNDVDLDTLAALEGYLAEFNGVLVIVSHDRFFVDKVTQHLFVFEGDGVVKDYLGSLSDYAECLIADEK